MEQPATVMVTKLPLYRVWANMKTRCGNPANKDYKYYGARGIRVCDRWMVFKNFNEDMSPRPVGMTLDRINGNGNYEPSNCRWATRLEQSHNRDISKHTINGTTKSLEEWWMMSKVSPFTARYRYYELGWSIPESIGLINKEKRTWKTTNQQL